MAKWSKIIQPMFQRSFTWEKFSIPFLCVKSQVLFRDASVKNWKFEKDKKGILLHIFISVMHVEIKGALHHSYNLHVIKP